MDPPCRLSGEALRSRECWWMDQLLRRVAPAPTESCERVQTSAHDGTEVAALFSI